MPTNFGAQEVKWLRAAKRSFMLEPITKPFDKELFIEKLKGVLSPLTDRSRKNDLLEKIDKIATDEFWESYGRDFS
jgi:hypothetical protein